MAFDETLARRIRTILDARKDLVEKHMFGGVCFMIRGRKAWVDRSVAHVETMPAQKKGKAAKPGADHRRSHP